MARRDMRLVLVATAFSVFACVLLLVSYAGAGAQRLTKIVEVKSGPQPVLPEAAQASHAGVKPDWPPTREMLNGIVNDDNQVTVVGVTFEYLDLFEMLETSIRRAGVNNLLVVCLDRPAYDVLSKHYPDRTYIPPFAPDSAYHKVEYATNEFSELTKSRPAFIFAFLKLGVNVLYVDTDMIWRSNPYDFLKTVMDDYDIAVPHDSVPSNVCTAFVYAKSNPAALAYVEAWINAAASGSYMHDQQAWHGLYPGWAGRFRLLVLEQDRFPNGWTMFYNGGYNWTVHPEGPIIVHANFKVGHDTKKEELLKFVK
ncbi:unnamed protein product (mitochondrion) [Plasmodiophora brassicae]|uniref:Nucleotide-diphospho-sugar transferase domain-containing protein n=1 Tax=Plasmodiophora brassicae TaxID=37360 RepID=A0A0G4IWX3_PLABS|nr:hypothetical protein PBRA_007319 [Plasmodiophora brassicae]SPQ95917.1 unnamed protein product [Plasmodiophora brassicae]